MLFLAFLLWVVCIIAAALVASSKNRSSGAWAAAGAFFGVFALIVVACLETLPTAAEVAAKREADASITKVCPRCAERVKAAALVCRFCDHEFDPSSVIEAPVAPTLPWTLVQDHGNGYGVFEYRGDRLVYGPNGVKWMGSTFQTPEVAIASVDGYKG